MEPSISHDFLNEDLRTVLGLGLPVDETGGIASAGTEITLLVSTNLSREIPA